MQGSSCTAYSEYRQCEPASLTSSSIYFSGDLEFLKKPLLSPIKDPVKMDNNMNDAGSSKRQHPNPLEGANLLAKLARTYDRKIQETRVAKGLESKKGDEEEGLKVTKIGETIAEPKAGVKPDYRKAPVSYTHLTLPTIYPV